MSRTRYNETWEYEIFEDGYDLYNNGVLSITQRDPYGKVFKADGSYEENALIQLDQLNAPPAPPIPTDVDILRSDIDFMALMDDITLPSQEAIEEGE